MSNGMRWGLFACALASFACGGATSRAPDTWAPVTRSAATRLDVEALLARIAKEQLCKQLDGRFIPISMEPPPAGPAAGLAVSTGAWWIRSCTPALLGNYLVAFELTGRGGFGRIGAEMGSHC